MVALKNNAFMVVILLVGTVGCAPLQQAPLVYASKVSVGVDVSTTTTEQPGLSITLGYKQVDAAYVPVAVAKPCEKADTSDTKSNCTDRIYQLEPIAGTYGSDISGVPQSTLDAARKRVDDFMKILQTRDDAVKNLEIAVTKQQEVEKNLNMAMTKQQDAQKILDRATSDRKNIDTSSTEGASEAAKTAADRAVLDAQAAKTAADKAVLDAQAGKTAADKAVLDAQAAKATADKAYEKADKSGLAEDLKLVRTTNEKKDSYSVFGTFNANTKVGVEPGGGSAPKAEAGVVIGKVFSTGVASQNLTEGMNRYYRAIGATQCLTAGETLISAYKETLKLSDDNDKQKLQDFIDSVRKECLGRSGTQSGK